LNTKNLRKFCPVCKLANDVDAAVCGHCGATLHIEGLEPQTTRRVGNSFQLTEEIRDQVISTHTPPPLGLSLFLLNNGEPIVLSKEPELVLGRGEIPSSEPAVDLTKFDGFAAGVSRRHAMIKAVDNKYVLIDLNSSNGTWLNGERLFPNKPQDLPSGGVIQLGRLKLVVFYNRPPTPKNQK
jgi:FHA domain